MGAEVGLTPVERVERVKMALAEAGWPDVLVTFLDRPWAKGVHVPAQDPEPPDEVLWRAFAVGDPTHTPCWSCWLTDEGLTCQHDPLTSPWPPPPEVPR